MEAIRPDINYDRSGDKKLTASGKIRSLILVLDTGGSSEEKCDALTRLCSCCNRIHDREVWQRIFIASEDDGLANSTEGKARHRHALKLTSITTHALYNFC